MKRQEAGALVVIALLLAYWFLQPVSLALKGLATVLVVIGVARPVFGVLTFAGLAPLSTAIAALFGGAGLGGQLLEVMALAIGAGVIVSRGTTARPTHLGRPGLLMAVLTLASAWAMMPAAAAPFARSLADGPLIDTLMLRRAAHFSPVWGPLLTAVTMAECALLGWAVERIVQRTPHLASRLVLIGLAGHAGSAALSLQAIAGAALRTGHAAESFPQLLMSIRYSMQTDWNAAASGLLLAGVAGFGIIGAKAFQRVGIGLLLMTVAAGLWITSSRSAIVLAVVAVVQAVGWLLVRTRRHRVVVATALVGLTLVAGGWLAMKYPEGRNDKPVDTLRGRLVLMQAGIRMFETGPVFGIGVDQFYGASPRFTPPATSTTVPENAHNNFVQVLAELGLAGLCALLWWLWVIVAGGMRAQVQHPDRCRAGLLFAIVMCVGTWMTGHPLLVPEFAFVFWLYAGTLMGTVPVPTSVRSPWAPGLLIVVILVSIPWRAQALRNEANLEYRGLGMSVWQHDDTQRYREAGRAFALYLPATGRPVEVPFRRAPGTPSPLVVDIRIGDQVVNTVSINGDDWQSIIVTVPEGSRRFALVDFVVDDRASGLLTPGVVLRVGRETAR